METQVDRVVEASSIFATMATRMSVPRPTLPEKGQRRHPVEQQRDLAALSAQERLGFRRLCRKVCLKLNA
jgi:hypothetical protein